MIIYFVTFLFSASFAYLAKKSKKNGKNSNFYFFSFCAIILPSLLAGFRSVDVGTDVKIYIRPIFYQINGTNSFNEFLKISDVEFLFSSLSYICIKFFNNINVLLFVIHLIICSFIYWAIIQNDDVPIFLSLLIFYFIFYNRSLNLMRQFIAIAIIFYAAKYIETKKFFRYIIFVLIAMGFHASAILGILFYPLIHLTKNNKNLWLKCLIVVLCLLIFAFYNNILLFLVRFNIIPLKYYYRYQIDYSYFNFQYLDTLMRVIFFAVILLQKKQLIVRNEFNSSYIFIFLLDLIILQLGNFTEYAYRISLYTGIFSLKIVPQLISSTNIKNNKLVYSSLILSVICTYWIYIYIYNNVCETYPYIFMK